MNHSVQAKGYSGKLSVSHNYILVYQKTEMFVLKLQRTEENNKNYSNPDNDPKGDWRSGDVRMHYGDLILCMILKHLLVKLLNIHQMVGDLVKKHLKKNCVRKISCDDENRIIRKIYLSSRRKSS